MFCCQHLLVYIGFVERVFGGRIKKKGEGNVVEEAMQRKRESEVGGDRESGRQRKTMMGCLGFFSFTLLFLFLYFFI